MEYDPYLGKTGIRWTLFAFDISLICNIENSVG